MPVLLQILDEDAGGKSSSPAELELESGCLTLRELIRRRIEAEVARYNQTRPEVFRGLVQPTESERVLNGYRVKQFKPLSAAEQVARAFAAFEQNGFFVLLGDRQVETLDDEIELADRDELRFVRLVPLIGG